MRSPKTGHSRGLAAVMAAVVAVAPEVAVSHEGSGGGGSSGAITDSQREQQRNVYLPTNARRLSRRLRSRPAPNPQAALMAPS